MRCRAEERERGDEGWSEEGRDGERERERERERNILTERERERNILADECT